MATHCSYRYSLVCSKPSDAKDELARKYITILFYHVFSFCQDVLKKRGDKELKSIIKKILIILNNPWIIAILAGIISGIIVNTVMT